MPSQNYRYYCLDGAGHVDDARWIEAQTDKDAIALVETANPDVTRELWHGTRLVAKLWPRRLSA